MSLSLRERGLKCPETNRYKYASMSLSLRERGLKSFIMDVKANRYEVALLARAWIEIITADTGQRRKKCRSPCESVD